jgi:hypothetical protein
MTSHLLFFVKYINKKYFLLSTYFSGSKIGFAYIIEGWAT